MSGNWHDVEIQLSDIENRALRFIAKKVISGGCINQAWQVTDNYGDHYFIKTNSPALENMFAVEANTLRQIAQSNSIRVPHVLIYGSTSEFSYLVLEYIPLKPQLDQKKLGKQLAQMHLITNPLKHSSNRFGWTENNYIGSTPQSNQYHQQWGSFWKNERLLYQLNLAKNKGYSTNAYDAGLRLAESIPLFFTCYDPKPSLLHGDLWGGNCASDMNDNPVLYDPASYYGDRETDIAMTELFGGFNADFYTTYNDCYTLDSGYKTRKILYNLYHILNHYNLFGGGYAKQAENMTKQLLSET
jgi:fructosamine-3-kinase